MYLGQKLLLRSRRVRCLLIARSSVRSERQFCERLQYDLLFSNPC